MRCVDGAIGKLPVGIDKEPHTAGALAAGADNSQPPLIGSRDVADGHGRQLAGALRGCLQATVASLTALKHDRYGSTLECKRSDSGDDRRLAVDDIDQLASPTTRERAPVLREGREAVGCLHEAVEYRRAWPRL